VICLHRKLPFNLVIVADRKPKHGLFQVEFCRKDPNYSTHEYPIVSGRSLLLRFDKWGRPWHVGLDWDHKGWVAWWWRFVVEWC